MLWTVIHRVGQSSIKRRGIFWEEYCISRWRLASAGESTDTNLSGSWGDDEGNGEAAEEEEAEEGAGAEEAEAEEEARKRADEGESCPSESATDEEFEASGCDCCCCSLIRRSCICFSCNTRSGEALMNFTISLTASTSTFMSEASSIASSTANCALWSQQRHVAVDSWKSSAICWSQLELSSIPATRNNISNQPLKFYWAVCTVSQLTINFSNFQITVQWKSKL